MKQSYLLLGLLAGFLLGYLFLSQNKAPVSPEVSNGVIQSTPEASVSAQITKTRTKTANCLAQNGLQDKECTPGQIIPGVTKDQICVPGYSKSVRNVPESEKKQVYESYGISERQLGEYEVDHLISLELGGSNDISNLWPEAADPVPGFHEKDKVENYLHSQVCSGIISLEEAQNEISSNWLQVFNKINQP